MTQRAERAGVFSEKRKLSKYETCLESAYRQKDVYTATSGETTTLTSTPDFIVVPDVAADITLTLPTSYFDEDKTVEVINNEDTQVITVSGVTCTNGEKTTLHFDGSSWSKLYSVTLT